LRWIPRQGHTCPEHYNIGGCSEHLQAAGLQSLYDAGKVAVMPAVDYRPSDMSHFHAAPTGSPRR